MDVKHEDVRSLVLYDMPFAGPGLLIVVEDSVADLAGLLHNLPFSGKTRMEMICLRMSELWQLAVPEPHRPKLTRYLFGFVKPARWFTAKIFATEYQPSPLPDGVPRFGGALLSPSRPRWT